MNSLTKSQQECLRSYIKALRYGASKLAQIPLNIRKVRLKKKILYTSICATQAYAEDILKLMTPPNIGDKASWMLIRALFENLVNTSWIYSLRNNQNAATFIADEIHKRIKFAENYKRLINDNPTWNVTFGRMKTIQDWDEFISEQQKELKKVERSLGRKIELPLPRLFNRALKTDEAFEALGKLNEKTSLVLMYRTYYDFFSQPAHLNVSGLNRFFTTNQQGEDELSINGKPEDIEVIIPLAQKMYLEILRHFLKQFDSYKAKEFPKQTI